MCIFFHTFWGKHLITTVKFGSNLNPMEIRKVSFYLHRYGILSLFCLSQPLAAWPDQVSLRDKTWKETIFKIMARRINVSISSVARLLEWTLFFLDYLFCVYCLYEL